MYCRALILLTIGFIAKTSAHYVSDSKSGYTLILPENDLQQPLALPFEEAQQWCSTNVSGSQLASISDKVTHDSIASFLDNATREGRLTGRNTQLSRLNGRYHPSNKWSWINGQEARGFNFIETEGSSGIYLNGVISAPNCHIFAVKPTIRYYYICEYPDIRKKCQLYLNKRCYETKAKHHLGTWYEVRNDCLNEGGDLASFETLSNRTLRNSLMNLSSYSTNTSKYGHWVGIQNGAWIWGDSNSSIQLTNWAYGSPNNSEAQCLCLYRLSHWKWMECSCSEPLPFICIGQLKETVIPLERISTVYFTNPVMPLERTVTDYFTITSIVIGMFCLCVISSIVVGIIVKRRTAMASSGAPPEPHYQDLLTIRMQENQTTGETYASIQLQPEYAEVSSFIGRK